MQKQRIASADPIDDYSDWRQSDWASEVDDGWFWQLIRGRRSVRRYLPDPVERSLLEKLLTAAIWAPSAHNRQPWRFCVVTSDLVKQGPERTHGRTLARRPGRRWRRRRLDRTTGSHQPHPHHRRARAGRGLRLSRRDGRLPRPPPPGGRMAHGRAKHRPGLPESAPGSAPIRPRRLLDVRAPVRFPNWCGMPSACPTAGIPRR